MEIKIVCDEDVALYMTKHKKHKEERVYLITLNNEGRVIKKRLLFKGTVNTCNFHQREILHYALRDLAISIIIVHNHPSGSLRVSSHDLQSTSRLNKCCELMGIKLLDHVVISKNGHVSIREEFPDAFDTEFVY